MTRIKTTLMGAVVLCLMIITTSLDSGLQAAVFMTVQESLDAAFSGSDTVTRRTFYLTENQAAEAARLAGVPADTIRSLVVRYDGYRTGTLMGSAYIDTHRVRHTTQTLMILITPDNRVHNVMLLASDELPGYHPPASWLRNFVYRGLDDLRSRKPVDAVTGATITSRAVTGAVRRVLAIHQVISRSR
jgi:uncharacterized protein with FMN-binding domain